MKNFNNRRYLMRRCINSFNLAMSMVTLVFALTFLFWILWTLFSNGLAYLTPQVFTDMTPPPGRDGVLLNATAHDAREDRGLAGPDDVH